MWGIKEKWKQKQRSSFDLWSDYQQEQTPPRRKHCLISPVSLTQSVCVCVCVCECVRECCRKMKALLMLHKWRSCPAAGGAHSACTAPCTRASPCLRNQSQKGPTRMLAQPEQEPERSQQLSRCGRGSTSTPSPRRLSAPLTTASRAIILSHLEITVFCVCVSLPISH